MVARLMAQYHQAKTPARQGSLWTAEEKQSLAKHLASSLPVAQVGLHDRECQWLHRVHSIPMSANNIQVKEQLHIHAIFNCFEQTRKVLGLLQASINCFFGCKVIGLLRAIINHFSCCN